MGLWRFIHVFVISYKISQLFFNSYYLALLQLFTLKSPAGKVLYLLSAGISFGNFHHKGQYASAYILVA
jgi:hypothetical protein